MLICIGPKDRDIRVPSDRTTRDRKSRSPPWQDPGGTQVQREAVSGEQSVPLSSLSKTRDGERECGES